MSAANSQAGYFIEVAHVARCILGSWLLYRDEVKRALTAHQLRTVGVVNSFNRKHRLQLKGTKNSSTKSRHLDRIITQ